jgi:type I restriction enzyme S subunit
MKQDWEIKRLGQVLIIERGGSPRPIEKYITSSPDGINWIKISDATASDKYIYETKEKITRDGLHKTRVVNDGDFILSNSMSFGRPYIMKTTGCIHDGWLVLKQTDKKLFETEFLYYLLSSPFVYNQFNGLAAGSTVRNLNISLVSSVIVPIPPLQEQLRITTILDEVFSSIAKAKANAEQNLNNAKDLFESYLQSIFSNKDGGWEEKTLGEVCEMINRGVSPRYIEREGLIVLNQKCIRDHKVSFEQSRFHDGSAKKVTSEKFLRLGDVLINSTGVGTLGRVAQVRTELKNVIVDSHITIVRPLKNLFFLDFFGWALIFIEDEIAKRGEGCGGQTELARNTLKDNFTLCFPKFISAQEAIVRKLDSLLAETKKLEYIYHQKLNDLEELKKSMLQKAFIGELKTTNRTQYELERS